MANEIIREAASSAGIRLWQIADELGMADGNFSRKLRKEFASDEQARVLSIIQKLAEEGRKC